MDAVSFVAWVAHHQIGADFTAADTTAQEVLDDIITTAREIRDAELEAYR